MPGKRQFIPFLPTMLTLGNLVCGFIAAAKTVDALQHAGGTGPLDPLFAGKIVQAAWFVMAALVFDALDGRVARLMHLDSRFGSQLDSLADAVTFGMAPALIAKVTYEHTMVSLGKPFHPGIVTVLCSLYLIGAVLRLARFTVGADAEEARHDTFLGLPSPAAAATIVTACFFVFTGRTELGLPDDVADTAAVWLLRSLPGIAAALGVLMISRVRYVHLAQRYVRKRTRVGAIGRWVLVVWIIVLFHEWLLFVVALVYVIGGALLWMRASSRGQSPVDALPAPWDPDDEDEDIDGGAT